MKLLHLKPRDRALVCGKTGFGKSTHLKECCAAWMADGCNLVVWDPLDEYSVHGERRPDRTLGPLTQRVTVEEFEEDPESFLLASPLALAIVTESEDEDEIAEDFAIVARLLRAVAKSYADLPLVFVIEEVGQIADDCQRLLTEIACRWRHYGIGVAFAAQYAVAVPKKARRQLSQIASFRQDDPEDLEALAKVTRSEAFAERVSRLGVGEWEHWQDTGSQRSNGKGKGKGDEA